MSKTIFILGAGASKQAGVPLMDEFLDISRNLWESRKVEDSDEDFKRVFNGISALQAVHSKSQLNIHNVESVFAAFEMARILNTFPGFNNKNQEEEIEKVINSMKKVIIKTIEQTLLFLVSESVVQIPKPYDKFWSLYKYLIKKAEPEHTIAIITFNYDMACDFFFFKNKLNVDYALEDIPIDDAVPLLKLHGSLNWAKCSEVERIVPWNLDKYFKIYGLPEGPIFVPIEIGSLLSNFKYINKFVEPEPIIVPPTWNKTEHHQVISRVWRRAAKELSEAENIFVIGYSLPDSDLFFTYLYSLGTIGKTILNRFWVFNPDESLKPRFEQLLGPGAKERFQYYPVKFDDSIHILLKEFQKK